MSTITTASAMALVRAQLDEIDPNGSIMYETTNSDNASLDSIIINYLPIAIDELSLAAPVWMLEGESASCSTSSFTGGVSITLSSTPNFLRLVSFKGTGTDYTITDVIHEGSAEDHKQANAYIRGTSDRPRLVMLAGFSGAPSFKCYGATGVSSMLIIKSQAARGSQTSYTYSHRLRQNIIDLITARVLETFNDARAQAYYNKAYTFNA